MIFQVLQDGRIWIQFILVNGDVEEKFKYSSVLSQYGTYSYMDDEIIEFISFAPEKIPDRQAARNFVMKINEELQIAELIEK